VSLIVENATPVEGADTYVTLAVYQAYGAALGWTLGADDNADEINLRRAYQGINRNWTYKGKPVDADQTGAFPRINSEGIPQRVKDAQIELAFLVQGGLDLFATVESITTSETIKVGPISLGSDSLPTGRARVVAVQGLLRPYLAAGAGQVSLVRG
jgi:hypothetical protein